MTRPPDFQIANIGLFGEHLPGAEITAHHHIGAVQPVGGQDIVNSGRAGERRALRS